MKEKFGDSEEIDEILQWLKSLGAIDDSKNRAFYINQLKSRCYGTRYIKEALKRRGFDGELDFHENDELDIKKWYEKKFKNFKKPFTPRELGKIYRYLLSKGFLPDEIFNFLRKEGIYEG